MRADARRNRERLLAAADQVFAEHGVTVSTEQVARAAGVGVGTVFRHFPTKERLLEAVYFARIERLADHAESLADQADPAAAFDTFFTATVEAAVTKNALVEALAQSTGAHPGAGEAGPRLRTAIAALLRRAQRDGGFRDDLDVPEIMALMTGTSRAVEQLSGDPAARRRLVDVVLRGLRG